MLFQMMRFGKPFAAFFTSNEKKGEKFVVKKKSHTEKQLVFTRIVSLQYG
jgi:hypothetical protein